MLWTIVILHGLLLTDYTYAYDSNSSSVIKRDQRLLSESQLKRSTVKLLVYDRVQGYVNWLLDWFKQGAIRKCSTRCYISSNVDDQAVSDVVIFHAPTHESLPKRLPQNSLFVMISLEQPQYAKILSRKDYLEKNFDLLATYSLSDTFPGTSVPNMPVTYFPLNIVSLRSFVALARVLIVLYLSHNT